MVRAVSSCCIAKYLEVRALAFGVILMTMGSPKEMESFETEPPNNVSTICSFKCHGRQRKEDLSMLN